MSVQDLDLATVLRTKGYRLTTQRQLVLDAVGKVGAHSTADDIYERVHAQAAAINRATVYRTLHFLCSIGMITSTSLNGGRLAYERTPAEPHHHLICARCGDTQTLSHELVAPLLATIATTHDFEVVDTLHLSLFGVCAECRPTVKARPSER